MQDITDFADLDLNGTYSYADYLLWRFEQSVELIKGKIFKMPPDPNVRYQRILFIPEKKWFLKNIFKNRFFCTLSGAETHRKTQNHF